MKGIYCTQVSPDLLHCLGNQRPKLDLIALSSSPLQSLLPQAPSWSQTQTPLILQSSEPSQALFCCLLAQRIGKPYLTFGLGKLLSYRRVPFTHLPWNIQIYFEITSTNFLCPLCLHSTQGTEHTCKGTRKTTLCVPHTIKNVYKVMSESNPGSQRIQNRAEGASTLRRPRRWAGRNKFKS